jgi:hypothetical protein
MFPALSLDIKRGSLSIDAVLPAPEPALTPATVDGADEDTATESAPLYQVICDAAAAPVTVSVSFWRHAAPLPASITGKGQDCATIFFESKKRRQMSREFRGDIPG